MLLAEHTVTSQAPAEKIWKIWTDVLHWTEWDSEIEYAKMDDKFQLGGTGVLKPKGGPKTRFKIIALQEGISFTDISFLPLTKLYFKHTITSLPDGGCSFTHRIEISGILSFLFSKILGPKMRASLPQAMGKLNQLALI